MKNKIFLLIYAALVCWLTAMLVFSCAKTEEPALVAGDQKSDLRSNVNDIPSEVAQWLTEAEIAAFWASKPTKEPPAHKEKGEKRPKKWRPFFVWGETIGRNLPVLSACPTMPDPNPGYANAQICFNPGDCPGIPVGPPLTPPFVGYVDGEGHMSGYGKIIQEWKRFVCPAAPPRLNGAYVKDEHRLHWRPLPGAAIEFKDGLYRTTLTMKVCNAALPLDEQCWALSTGDFDDSDGTFKYRIITTWNFAAPPPLPFFATLPAYRIAWGWVWY